MADRDLELLTLLEKVGKEEQTVLVSPAETVAPTMVGVAQDRSFAPISSKNIWVHHDTHPVVFDVSLLKQYGTDWFVWEAETLWKEIKEDFHIPSISDHSKAKIQAIKTLHITEAFWERWEFFCWINQALNNNISDWLVLQKPSLAQLFNTADISSMVRQGEQFSVEVKGFMAAAVVDEGVFYTPHPIEFCQEEVTNLLNELNIPDHVKLMTQVQDRYREIISVPIETWTSSGDPILLENAVDIQVAKLKVAWDYLSKRRNQLKDQLRLLT